MPICLLQAWVESVEIKNYLPDATDVQSKMEMVKQANAAIKANADFSQGSKLYETMANATIALYSSLSPMVTMLHDAAACTTNSDLKAAINGINTALHMLMKMS